MQKKLLAVAVAGVLAAPAVALAQSSVTISGNFKVSLESLKINNFNNTNPPNTTTRTGNSSENRMADDSSRIIFNVREDLGGGLSAVGQYDIRIKFDDPGAAAATNVGGGIASGNSHVGLQNYNSWGRIIFGRQDLHYGNTESRLTAKAASLRADSISVISYMQGPAGNTPIANTTRTQNVTMWSSPTWGGMFTAQVAYSTNPFASDADIGTNARKGSAWNVNPNFAGANWQAGYSYWKAKPDAPIAVSPAGIAITTTCAPGTNVTLTPGAAVGGTCVGTSTFAASGVVTTTPALDQRSDRLYGSYGWGGFRIGLAWDRSRLDNPFAATGTVEVGKRDAWSIPIEYVMGNHNFLFHYTKADDDKSSSTTAGTVKAGSVAGVCGTATTGGAGSCSFGAKMWSLAYVYDMSKRTTVGLTYSKINNDNGANYNFFTSTSLGNPSGAVVAGEDPRLFAATIRHGF